MNSPSLTFCMHDITANKYSKNTKQEHSYESDHFFIVCATASNRSLHFVRYYLQTLVIVASMRFQSSEERTKAKSQQSIVFSLDQTKGTEPTESNLKFQKFFVCFVFPPVFQL